jgi:hypothetical protein
MVIFLQKPAAAGRSNHPQLPGIATSLFWHKCTLSPIVRIADHFGVKPSTVYANTKKKH